MGTHSPILKTLDDLRKFRKTHPLVIMTNGCFDLFHAGHAMLLDDIGMNYYPTGSVVVALNSDASVRRLKGTERPVIPEVQRAYILSCHKAVDAVHIFDEDTPIEVVKALQPDILVKGGDWSVDNIVGAKETKARGGNVVIFKLLKVDGKVLSTGTIIDRIFGLKSSGWVKEAGVGKGNAP